MVHSPPTVLCSARVLVHAHVGDDIEYTGKTAVFVDGEAIGRVPHLAICETLAQPGEILLLYCDESWSALAVVGEDSLEDAKLRCERDYPGIGQRWHQLDTTREEALEAYDRDSPGACSFCGKRPYEIEGLMSSETARICRGCVEEFYDAFRRG